jgi:hypothetical protein
MPHQNNSTDHIPLPIATNSDDEETLRGSRKSQSELLAVLPDQRFSAGSNGILDLTFSLPSTDVAQSLSVKLIVDSAPGCGGIAWPAGQVMPPLTALSVELLD